MTDFVQQFFKAFTSAQQNVSSEHTPEDLVSAADDPYIKFLMVLLGITVTAGGCIAIYLCCCAPKPNQGESEPLLEVNVENSVNTSAERLGDTRPVLN